MPRRGRCALLGGACSHNARSTPADAYYGENSWINVCLKFWYVRSAKGRSPMCADRKLICTVDKLAYPIRDGIPALLVEEARRIVEGKRGAAFYCGHSGPSGCIPFAS